VTWNCRRAAIGSAVWDYLLELVPDVALLQEVVAVPQHVGHQYACLLQRAKGKSGSTQSFGTALLVKGRFGEPLDLPAPATWISAELERFAGNLVACQLLPNRGPAIKAISVHSPAWHLDRERLSSIDVAGVRLTQNPDVWLADILWASLQHLRPAPQDHWIVAGDFNLSETFDFGRGGPRGNREYLDRMEAIGLVECLRRARGALTPTYRNTGVGAIVHQLDHLFTTDALTQRLVACDVAPRNRVLDANLSDHLPIVADFRWA